MQPRIDFLLHSPFLLPYPRKQGVPAHQTTKLKSFTDTKQTNTHEIEHRNKPLCSKRQTQPGVGTRSVIKLCMKEIGSKGERKRSLRNLKFDETKKAKIFPKDIRSTISYRKIQQLEHKLKLLEGELREAAVVVYSIVADHESFVSQVDILVVKLCGVESNNKSDD